MGFHAAVRGPQGQRPGTSTRRSTSAAPASTSATTAAARAAAGGGVRRARAPARSSAADADRAGRGAAAAARSTQRVYRLALLTDPTYAEYFGTENVLAEKVTLINRVNQVYNDDLAIKLQLDRRHRRAQPRHRRQGHRDERPVRRARLLRPGPGDPATRRGQLASATRHPGAHRTVLGQLVGASNYDIGHIALGVNGGGIAGLGVVGGDRQGAGAAPACPSRG